MTSPATTPPVLTIAGSDPSGGAGIQADLKTFQHFGTYGMAVVSLLTVQNTREVKQVHVLEPTFVAEQLDAVLADIPPRAAKTGALGSVEVIDAVAERARSFEFPLIMDPVMISKHGAMLLDDDAISVLRGHLLPHAFLVTPNMPEAAALANRRVETVDDMADAARAIADLGPAHVLVKGGRLEGEAIDVLCSGGQVRQWRAEHLASRHIHGTGCVFAAALTALMARGATVDRAVETAKSFISRAIAEGPPLGAGHGPVNMHAAVKLPDDLLLNAEAT